MDNLDGGTYYKGTMIDAHAHLSFLKNQQVQQIMNASGATVNQWVLGGYDSRDWRRQMELKVLWPRQIQVCLGLHPWAVTVLDKDEIEANLRDLEPFLPGADWMGELGVDVSKKVFRQKMADQVFALKHQLKLAQAYNKPCVFHVVGGFNEFLKCWDAHPASGFIHGFSGPPEVARELTSRGLMISVGPGLLKSHFKKLQKTVEVVDLGCVLLESDSPTNPQDESYQGFDLLPRLAKRICEIRSVSLPELKNQINRNFQKLSQKEVSDV